MRQRREAIFQRPTSGRVQYKGKIFPHSRMIQPQAASATRAWEKIDTDTATTPSPRTGHVLVEHEGEIYLFGGCDNETGRLNDLYRFNTVTETWYKLNPTGDIPTPRSLAAGCVLDRLFYVFGGKDVKKEENEYLNDFYAYSFKENKWTRIQCELNLERSFEDNITLCNPTKRADHTLVGVNGNVYVYGGDNKNRSDEYLVHRKEIPKDTRCNVMAFSKHKWHGDLLFSETIMPSLRFGHTCVYYNNALWIFGGYNYTSVVNSLWHYDLSDNQWTPIGSTYDEIICDSIHGNPVSMCLQTFTNRSKVRAYIEERAEILKKRYGIDVWKYRVYPQWPSPRYRHCAAVHNGKMYVFGGVDNHKKKFNDLHAFDFVSQTWEIINIGNPTFIPALTFHQMVVLNDYLYVWGGIAEVRTKRLNDMYRIYLGTGGPLTLFETCKKFIAQNGDTIKNASEYPLTYLHDILGKDVLFKLILVC